VEQLLVEGVAVPHAPDGARIAALETLFFAMIPELLAMVGGDHHEGVPSPAELPQAVEETSDLLVDVEQGAVVEGDLVLPEALEIGRLPVFLVDEAPLRGGGAAPRAARFGDEEVAGIGLWRGDRLVEVHVLEIEKERPLGTLPHPGEGPVGQALCGAVARLGVVEAALEAAPEVGIGREERRPELRPVEVVGEGLRLRPELRRVRVVELPHFARQAGAVLGRVEGGEEAADRRHRPGGGREGVLEDAPLPRQGVDSRGGGARVAVSPHVVGAQGVDADHHHVLGAGTATEQGEDEDGREPLEDLEETPRCANLHPWRPSKAGARSPEDRPEG